jgi:hypothetical protein
MERNNLDYGSIYGESDRGQDQDRQVLSVLLFLIYSEDQWLALMELPPLHDDQICYQIKMSQKIKHPHGKGLEGMQLSTTWYQ